jgi:ribose transport system ATP-binding protein
VTSAKEQVATDLASPHVLEARGIRKSFHGVEVLHGVDFVLNRGEIHGIAGQNGAGKSTLVKILNGVYERDGGEIRIGGTVVHDFGPHDSGIAMVFQNFSLIPSMTVAQNILLTREPRKLGLIDDKAAHKRVRHVLAEIGVELDPSALVGALPVGSRQLIEIAKALSQDPPILVLDEPTASLTRAEVDTLFGVIRRLAARGRSVIYISHHLQELIDVSDRVTVLRDGHVTLSASKQELSMEAIVGAMLGSSLETELVWHEREVDRTGPPLLRVEGLRIGDKIQDVSFRLHPGEIIGIAGLLGSGRTELLRALFGIDRPDGGTIEVGGRRATIHTPDRALKAGMALVPEDRGRAGLVPEHSVQMNILMAGWRKIARLGFVMDRLGERIVRGLIERLRIRTPRLNERVDRLSGGNQQKVVVAKNLTIEPRVLLLDDPTVGIDVKSRADLIDEIRELAGKGNGVLLVSSELEELSALADRVMILRGGAIMGWLDRARDEISEQSLSRAIQGA